MRAPTARKKVLAACESRGISVAPAGKGWHLYGDGVDIKVSDLHFVYSIDLKPYRPAEKGNQ